MMLRSVCDDNTPRLVTRLVRAACINKDTLFGTELMVSGTCDTCDTHAADAVPSVWTQSSH